MSDDLKRLNSTMAAIVIAASQGIKGTIPLSVERVLKKHDDPIALANVVTRTLGIEVTVEQWPPEGWTLESDLTHYARRGFYILATWAPIPWSGSHGFLLGAWVEDEDGARFVEFGPEPAPEHVGGHKGLWGLRASKEILKGAKRLGDLLGGGNHVSLSSPLSVPLSGNIKAEAWVRETVFGRLMGVATRSGGDIKHEGREGQEKALAEMRPIAPWGREPQNASERAAAAVWILSRRGEVVFSPATPTRIFVRMEGVANLDLNVEEVAELEALGVHVVHEAGTLRVDPDKAEEEEREHEAGGRRESVQGQNQGRGGA